MTEKYLSIQEAMQQGKGIVSVRGWVHRERGSNQLKFIVLRDSSALIQCVFERTEFPNTWDEIDHFQMETSVEITGIIKEEKRAPSGYEIHVQDYTLVGKSEIFPLLKINR